MADKPLLELEIRKNNEEVGDRNSAEDNLLWGPAEDAPEFAVAPTADSVQAHPSELNQEAAGRPSSAPPKAPLKKIEGSRPCAAPSGVGPQEPATAGPTKRLGRKEEIAAITSPENLRLAWRKVQRFGKEHEVYFDSKLHELYEESLEANLFVLRDRLLRMVRDDDTYVPEPFWRLRLTKANGGHRDIAIVASVEDGIVIQAVMNVLAPQIEKSFSPNSFGHRLAPNFVETDLVFQPWSELREGYEKRLQRFLWTPEPCVYVKGDIHSFYDKVDRRRLCHLIEEYVADDWTLSTIKAYLEYRLLLDDGTVQPTGRLGLPQGPAYAHFLANLYLDEFDRFVEEQVVPDQDALAEQETLRFMESLGKSGTKLGQGSRPTRNSCERVGYCRYVDDFFMLFASREEADRLMVEIGGKLAGWGLELSAEKTHMYDHTDTKPIYQELSSIEYTVGKLFDNDKSFSLEERSELYAVVESDFNMIAAGKDPGRAADYIDLVVDRLHESACFKRSREALLNLVIELLFMESVKDTRVGRMLKGSLPQIVRSHFAATFVEHLRQPDTPDMKRVLFLRAVQENGFFDELDEGLQECVRELLGERSFFVRFAAVNCLWANGQWFPYAKVRRLYKGESHPEIQGRLLNLMRLDAVDLSNAAVFIDSVASLSGAINYHALVASRCFPLALPRILHRAEVDHDDSALVEWLFAVLRCGGHDAVKALNRYLVRDGAAERVTAVYRIMLGQAYHWYETGALTAASILDLMDNRHDLTNQRIRDLLLNGLLLPLRESLVTTEENADIRERLAKYAEQDLIEQERLQDISRPPNAEAEDIGFLSGDTRVTYRAWRGLDRTLDIWETVDVGLIADSGRFESAYAWQEYLERAKKRGLADFQECRILSDSEGKPSAVHVHYRLEREYERIADRVHGHPMDEQAAAAVIAATATAHASLTGRAMGREWAPAISTYHLAVDRLNHVRFICLGSAFGRPRYVSLGRKMHTEDTGHWDSLFLGWLSFELVTGQCPLTEAKLLADEGGETRGLTLSKKLAHMSILHLRVLKLLTCESSEYRSSLSDHGVRQLLDQYREDVGLQPKMKKSNVPPAEIRKRQLLRFWELRVVDTWRWHLQSTRTEDRALDAYMEVAHDTEIFFSRAEDSFGELPSTRNLMGQGLHLISAGVDEVLRRLEEMQSEVAVSLDEAFPNRFGLCLMHLVLRYETMACAFAARHSNWPRWQQSEFANRLQRDRKKAALLTKELGRDDARLKDALSIQAVAPLALDLGRLAQEPAEHSSFERWGLAALAAFVYLVANDREKVGTRDLLLRLACWESQVAKCLSGQEPLTPKNYRELGEEQQALLELLRRMPAGRERHMGTLLDKLVPATTRKVLIGVEGLPEPVEVKRSAILALGPQSPDRNIPKDQPVSLDVIDGFCVAVSCLGTLERKLFAPVARREEAGTELGGAPVVESRGVVTAAPEEPPNQFYKDGEFWVIRYDGKQVKPIKDIHGLFYLSILLAHPDGEPISCLGLRSLLMPAPPPRHDDYYAKMSDKELAKEGLFVESPGGEKVMEPRARKEVGKRLQAYELEIEELDAKGPSGKATSVREEYEQLKRHLGKALGLNGKLRVQSPVLHNARTTVQKRIATALKKIKRLAPELGTHLHCHIRTSHSCSYTPDPPIQWKTEKED